MLSFLLGIAVGQDEIYLHPRTFSFRNIPIPFAPRFLDEHQFKDAIYQAVSEALSEKGEMTPFNRQKDRSVSVLSI